jgi:ferric-dicitrate binding protein FerR (iron transport regulator)
MEERFTYLFRKYLNNSCTRKEFDEFFSYIRDTAHTEKIKELINNVYQESGQEHSIYTYVNEGGKLVATAPALSQAPVSMARLKRKMYLAMAVAASIICLIWLGPFNSKRAQPPTPGMAMTKKITQRSEYKYLLLPDSTQVWLNAASTLEYPQAFSSGKREVYLSGEAYFDVKHADKIPFVIRSGKVSTVVLGTAFNIKAYPGRENVIVSVNRGKVRVQYEDKDIATLTRGQQVKVNSIGTGPAAKKHINTDASSWQQGQLTYDDETIEDIIAELEMVYDVRIQLNNAAVRNTRISTTLKREMGVDEALQVLCKISDTRLTTGEGVYIIQ